MNEFCTYLQKRAEMLGVTLSEGRLGQFERYYQLLIETNKVMNLTAITQWQEVIDKHFIDSLCLIHCEKREAAGKRMIDVGCGAGFPGIPIKIAFPEYELTCLDSLRKRVDFLETVIKMCELKNTEAHHARAEELARNLNYREAYDLVVSRAVSRLSVLTEYCTPFLKEGGYFISYKTAQVEEELLQAQSAIRKLNCQVEEVKKFKLPMTDMERSLVVIRKIEKTPAAYPRKAGTPEKKPL